ncbi:hypothetical protein [Pedobacter glucosidilyticus]|uniref:hypothetical protein n=1 Tax=Pedobacter glucosidilyticus TaxID=1122941 RepID=UPI0026F05F28|nr:hypothetical protein [Pedobacter glucosidilyticus]
MKILILFSILLSYNQYHDKNLQYKCDSLDQILYVKSLSSKNQPSELKNTSYYMYFKNDIRSNSAYYITYETYDLREKNLNLFFTIKDYLNQSIGIEKILTLSKKDNKIVLTVYIDKNGSIEGTDFLMNDLYENFECDIIKFDKLLRNLKFNITPSLKNNLQNMEDKKKKSVVAYTMPLVIFAN